MLLKKRLPRWSFLHTKPKAVVFTSVKVSWKSIDYMGGGTAFFQRAEDFSDTSDYLYNALEKEEISDYTEL